MKKVMKLVMACEEDKVFVFPLKDVHTLKEAISELQYFANAMSVGQSRSKAVCIMQGRNKIAEVVKRDNYFYEVEVTAF